MHQHRTYRNRIHTPRLKSFSVVVKETDLFVSAAEDLCDITREVLLQYRGYIENFIRRYPNFIDSLAPLEYHEPVPNIIADMLDAGLRAGVGPMAAVAGAIAEHVGRELINFSEEVIIENGGDVFLKSNHPVVIGIFANRSPLNLKLGLRIDPLQTPLAVCTSSGTVGHSLSLGRADAVCVLSASGSLADAAATAIGNRVRNQSDIAQALEFGKKIKRVDAIVIIKDDKIGMWGNLNLVPLKEKKVEF